MENSPQGSNKDRKLSAANAIIDPKAYRLRRKGRKYYQIKKGEFKSIPLKRGISYSVYDFPEAHQSTPIVDINSPLERIFKILEIKKEARVMINSLNYIQFKDPKEWRHDDNDQDEYVTAASLRQLILCLTSPDLPSIYFQKTFLLTYVSFTSPHVLLAALCFRFLADIKCDGCNIPNYTILNIIRARIIGIIRIWFNTGSYHFDRQMIQALDVFATSLATIENLQSQLQIFNTAFKNLIKNTQQEPQLQYVIPLDYHRTPINLMGLSAVEIASQFTYIHSSLFRAIGPFELLTVIWANKCFNQCINLIELNKKFDILSRFVSLYVIQGGSPKERTVRYLKWIDVGGHFLKLNNFHGLFAVVCGLTHPSVSRLEQTIKMVKKSNSSRLDAFKHLQRICDSAESFKNYRNLLPHVKGACVPFIGSFQKDLIYVQESFKNTINDLINFRKCTACVVPIQTMQQLQSEAYKIFPDQKALAAIRGLPEPSEGMALMKMSMQKETRKRKCTA